MLDKSVANDVIYEAISLGADFCDLFIEKSQIETISLNSSKIKDLKTGIDFGVGVRLIYGRKALYGYTNSPKKEDLIKLTRTLAQNYKKAAHKQTPEQFQIKEAQIIGSISNKEVALADKIAKLHEINNKTREMNKLIDQVNISLIQKRQRVQIFDSEGLSFSEERPYCRISTSAIAKDAGDQAVGYYAPGVRGGYQFIENLDVNYLADYVSTQAVTSLKARPAPAGKMPVVIDKGFGGVIFHEACGHSLETTSVEKKASEFWDKKDTQIAHECLSAVDDGTIDNLWGSLSIDDEGMPTQRTQLIKDGVLTNFLCDRMGEIKTGHPRTGSARRESYKYAPASRMRNTFIEPGKHKLEDLISSMEDGLYAKNMGGGSVNPGTGEFNFSVLEGYLVKNGKISEPVKGATLIGRGGEIMKDISMIADNLDYSAGICGSVSGGVPVTVGQPAVKVDKILVGGQAS